MPALPLPLPHPQSQIADFIPSLQLAAWKQFRSVGIVVSSGSKCYVTDAVCSDLKVEAVCFFEKFVDLFGYRSACHRTKDSVFDGSLFVTH